MNNSLYEEYMRSVLGYNMPDYRNSYNFDDMNFNEFSMMQNMSNEEMENCYPDIYRLVYPMVQKACMQNNRPLTRELIDDMTDEIYFSIEDNELTQQSRGKDEKSTEVKMENRQRIVRNRTLNDLIRILILRELLGRPGFPGRPPHPRPPRPPMRPPIGPGPRPRPGMGGPFNRDYDIFEN